MKARQAYRRASLEGPSEATRQAACQNPKWACLYAQKIDQEPRPDTRAGACADPHWALQYALHVDQCPRDETRAAAGKSAEQGYLYALQVDQRPHQATRAAASRAPRWARRYALDVDGAALETLEPSVGARAGQEGQAAVWHFRVGGEEAGERWRALPDAEQRRVAQAFAAWSGEVERRKPRASPALLLAACAFGLRPEWRRGKRRDQDYDYLVFLEGSSRRARESPRPQAGEILKEKAVPIMSMLAGCCPPRQAKAQLAGWPWLFPEDRSLPLQAHRPADGVGDLS